MCFSSFTTARAPACAWGSTRRVLSMLIRPGATTRRLVRPGAVPGLVRIKSRSGLYLRDANGKLVVSREPDAGADVSRQATTWKLDTATQQRGDIDPVCVPEKLSLARRALEYLDVNCRSTSLLCRKLSSRLRDAAQAQLQTHSSLSKILRRLAVIDDTQHTRSFSATAMP